MRTAFSFEQSSQACVFGYMCACLALRTTAYDAFLASLFGLIFALVGVGLCRENAAIPGRAYACSRGPGSSTRLCAVIHLCEGQGAPRAARRRHRAGGPVPMGGQPRELSCGPVVVPGSSQVRPNPGRALSSIRSADHKICSRPKAQPGLQVNLREDACMGRRSFRPTTPDFVILETSPA